MRRFPQLWVGLLLALGTYTVLLPVTFNAFVNYDDDDYVTANERVQAGLSWSGTAWAFRTFRAGNWHPLTWLSLQLDATLFGTEPSGFHHTNLVLHVANTVLLFLVLRRLTKQLGPSALVAGLFGLHPLHVESVAWVAERKDTLSTLFWILTLGAYALYAERPSVTRYLPVLAAFALGLLAKPMLVTLPFVLLLLDYWPLQRLQIADCNVQRASHAARCTLHAAILEKLPLFALAAGSCAVTLYVQRRGGAVRTLDEVPLVGRLGNVALAYVQYLGKTAWPRDLALFYPLPRVPPAAWQPAAAALALTVVTALVCWAGRRKPYLPVGWFWYLGTLVPVIGLVQVGEQALADRYTYVPHLGIFILVVWGGADLFVRWGVRQVFWPLMVLALLGCAVLSFRQAGVWRDSATLWQHAAEVTDGNYLAYHLWGRSLREPQAALPLYEEAVRLRPDYAAARLDLGALYLQAGDVDAALGHFREARATYVSRGAEPHYAISYNLGAALLRKGQRDEAAEQFEAALHAKPDHAGALGGLGDVDYLMGRYDAALARYAEAAAAAPRAAKYRYSRAAALLALGRAGEAAEEVAAAERLAADWKDLGLVEPVRQQLERYKAQRR